MQRSPVEPLLDVLEHDHPRSRMLHPRDRRPRQSADLLLARPPALGLAVVRAIGREPEQRYRSPSGGAPRVYLVDVLDVVLRRWVVRGVERDRFRAVVDRDVGRSADRPLDPGARAATASEQVNDELVVAYESADGGRQGHFST